jgi:hypothetical protein
MAEKSSTSIPWASLLMLGTFVSSTLLVPQAFDLTRPPEREKAQAASGSALEIEARLWEDPFYALRRHEQERIARCQSAKGPGATPQLCDDARLRARRDPNALRGELDQPGQRVLAVLVPGNPFVGAEEARRRTRHAVLDALQFDGFEPDHAEQIGLLDFDPRHLRADGVAASGPPAIRMQVPYERLSRRRSLLAADAVAGLADGVTVLWIDEQALPSPKPRALARLLHDTVPARAALRLIGPSTSDGLALAMRELRDEAGTRLAPARSPLPAEAWATLARARIFSPSATVAPQGLPELQGSWDDVEPMMRRQLVQLATRSDGFEFERTLADDNTVTAALVDELLLRLSTNPNGSLRRRIVLMVESDSVYSRGLADALERGFAARDRRVELEIVPFLRGLDGVTTRDGPDRAPAARPAANGAAPPATSVEWPESRDQLDHLRRRAAQLLAGEGRGDAKAIGAIGVLASDVHDKLLILQSLHDSFPDKVFFTTDLDARLLHPRVLPYTRNLIVASGLPLQLPGRGPLAERLAPSHWPKWRAMAADPTAATADDARSHRGTPPFRDSYQTSTWLAVRLANCEANCNALRDYVRAAIALPTVIELGRTQGIALSGLGSLEHAAVGRDAPAQRVVLPVLLLFMAALLLWPSTPALTRARQWWSAPAGHVSPWDLGTAALVSGYGALLGAVLAAVAEIAQPGVLGPPGTLAWTGLGGLAGVAVAYSPLPGRPWRSLDWRQGRWRSGAAIAGTLLAAAGLLWVALAQRRADVGHASGEPLRWLEGVSAWPTHLLHLMAALAVLVALDVVRDRNARTLPEDREALAALRGGRDHAWRPRTAVATLLAGVDASRAGGRRLLRTLGVAWARTALAAWDGDLGAPAHLASLWRRYERLARPLARTLRVFGKTLLLLVASWVLYHLFSPDYTPEVPVRGAEHRRIVTWGLYAGIVLLALVVAAVADATQLEARFVALLGRRRAVFPDSTIERYAQALGEAHAQRWRERLAADPARRGGADDADKRHTLLDDWIAIDVVARRTRVVAPMVLAPFGVVALFVLARSRLLDNWALLTSLSLVVGAYLVITLALALALKQRAERLRERALQRMQADLRWLGGQKPETAELAKPMAAMLEQVRNQRDGAFAPLLEQPILASLLLPLGGAGGAQLLDTWLLAR